MPSEAKSFFWGRFFCKHGNPRFTLAFRSDYNYFNCEAAKHGPVSCLAANHNLKLCQIEFLYQSTQVEIYRNKEGRILVHNKDIGKSRYLHRASSGGADDWTVVRVNGVVKIVSISGAAADIDLERLFAAKAKAKPASKVHTHCTHTV